MNPYHIRNAVRDDRYFFGRRRDLADIQALVGAAHPQSIAVAGDRRIGKSSLLQAVYRRLRCANDAFVIYQDVRGYQTDVDFLDRVARQLAASAQMDLPRGSSPADVLRRAVAQCCTGRKRIVMLLDEFDAISNNPSFEVTFFNFLRSLSNSWPVSFVLTARSELRDACHSDEVASSPFFNIFHERRLGCFTREESLELIRKPSEEAGFPLQPIERQLLDLAGDLPFFLRVACYWATAEAQAAGAAWNMMRVHARVHDDLRVHLAQLWEQLTYTERQACARAARHEPLTAFPPGTIVSLVTRGILVRTERGFDVSCQLLRSLAAAEVVAERVGNARSHMTVSPMSILSV